ncbi:MAG TPA: hypothetical protein VEQ58_22765 [Polyangiaceae bacterium]|nr:hypothetical protein [Polyangiaceae bacterium]
MALLRAKAHQASIAAASDGSVLLNVIELVSDDLRTRLTEQLGSLPIFVGVPLTQKDASDVIERLDGAAAEASAQLLGSRPKRRPKASGKRASKRR